MEALRLIATGLLLITGIAGAWVSIKEFHRDDDREYKAKHREWLIRDLRRPTIKHRVKHK